MSTRPTATPPEWATGVSAPVVEPLAGKKAVGWDPEERPPAEYMNWYMKGVFQWLTYFSEGNLEFNDVLVHGNLEVQGNAKVDGTTETVGLQTATGGVTTPSGLTLTGTAKIHHPATETHLHACAFRASPFDDGTQGVFQQIAASIFGGTGAIETHTMVVAGSNGTGSTSLVTNLDIEMFESISQLDVEIGTTGTLDSSTCIVTIERKIQGTPTVQTLFTGNTTFPAGAGSTAVRSLTVSPPVIISAGSAYMVRVKSLNTTGLGHLFDVVVTHSR